MVTWTPWRRPGPVGRPELLYRLTDRALELFCGGGNVLTLGVLNAVQHIYGPAAPTKILYSLYTQQAETYRQKIAGHTVSTWAGALAALRDADGYMAECEQDEPTGIAGAAPLTLPAGSLRIIEHHSPVEDLLRRFPILARLEREMFERVLGCPVRREEAEPKPRFYHCTFHLG